MRLIYLYNEFKIKVGMIFARIPIHQNVWTILVLILAIVGFFYLMNNATNIGLLFFILAGIVDVIDGAVAKVRLGESDVGSWLADFVNKGTEVFLLLGVQFVPFTSLFLPKEITLSLLWIYAFLFSYIKLYGFYGKILRETDMRRLPGFESAERIIPIYFGLFLYNFDAIYLSLCVLISILISTFRLILNIKMISERLGERKVKKMERLIKN